MWPHVKTNCTSCAHPNECRMIQRTCWKAVCLLCSGRDYVRLPFQGLQLTAVLYCPTEAERGLAFANTCQWNDTEWQVLWFTYSSPPRASGAQRWQVTEWWEGGCGLKPVPGGVTRKGFVPGSLPYSFCFLSVTGWAASGKPWPSHHAAKPCKH